MAIVEENAKFVQISATSSQSDIAPQVHTQLFALDDEGTVWAYRFQTQGGEKERWFRLSDERK
jgi:alpha-tubulin suppressor-like RCC1 family protein